MNENERLKELQKALNFSSQKKFADALGIKQGSLSDVYRGKSGIGVSDSIKKVLEKEYSINIKWLESGTGEMLKSEAKSEDAAHKVAMLEQQLAERDKYVEALQKELTLLRGAIEKDKQLLQAKDTIITLLEQQQYHLYPATEQGLVGRVGKAKRNFAEAGVQ